VPSESSDKLSKSFGVLRSPVYAGLTATLGCSKLKPPFFLRASNEPFLFKSKLPDRERKSISLATDGERL
jgi:hypothetical protein